MFADKLSGNNADRPELAACLEYLQPGDTLVVPEPGPANPSLADLIQIVTTLPRRGVGFKSLHEALDTTPGGRLIFHLFAALAEFIRELIVEGTREGPDAARGRGVRLRRPPAMAAKQIRHARDLVTRPDNTTSSIARLLSVSCATIYKYVPRGHRRAGSRRPASPGRSNWRAAPCSQESIRDPASAVRLRSRQLYLALAPENACSQGFGRRCAP
jgi:DNA invertase Pin-like site-specific DNA recombinase